MNEHDWTMVNEPYGSAAESLSREAFAARFLGRFLCVVVEDRRVEDTPEFSTLGGGPIPLGRGVLKVFPVAKRQLNPFSMMITFGRAPNNDLHVELSQVSKFHGYFAKSGEAWHVTDAGSTNGTSLNGVRLEHRVSAPVEVGAELSLGGVPAWFVDGAALYDLLTKTPTPA